MPTITRDMVAELNKRLANKGTALRIVDRDYPDARYTHNLFVDSPPSNVAPLVISEINYTNCGQSPQKYDVAIKKTMSFERTVTLKFGVKMGLKAEFKIGIVGLEMTAEINLEQSEAQKTTEQMTYDITYPLQIGPMKRSLLQAIVLMEKVTDVPFSLHVFLQGGDVLLVPNDLVKLNRYLQVGGGDRAGDHLYTTSVEHPEDHGYVEEGSPGYVFDHELLGTVALLRFFNGVDHLLTTDAREVAGHPTYQLEGTLGYIYPDEQPDTVPLYRYANGKDHFYTTDRREIGEQRGAYKLEFIAGYIVPSSVAEGGALRDVVEVLPDLDDRHFEVGGTFKGESTALNAEVTLLESTASVEECDLLRTATGRSGATEPSQDLFEARTAEAGLLLSRPVTGGHVLRRATTDGLSVQVDRTLVVPR